MKRRFIGFFPACGGEKANKTVFENKNTI